MPEYFHLAWPVAALLSVPLQATVASEPGSTPPPDCEARVGYDRDRVMLGYLLPTAAGEKTCIPFSTVAAYPPPGYQGDFYVAEFSDEKLRQRWVACKQDKVCYERVSKQVTARRPPNKEYHITDPKHVHLLGKVTARGEIDLKTIRRPAFFAAAPYHEAIAALDDRTYIVEFTAPADPHEQIHQRLTEEVKLRGWYIRGDGIDDGKGGKRRALLVMTPGGGGRITAITHPDDRLYRMDETGKTHINSFPTERSGSTGQQLWRQIATQFHRAGFDVLLHDRRGVGISSGFSDTNTLQQGRDLLAMIASLRTGEGMRAMAPAGKASKGRAAAELVRSARTDAGLPVVMFGNSRGTMATGWAMTLNFDKDCSYDLPAISCKPPVGDTSIKGAMLMAEFTSGPGYVMDRPSAEDEARGLGTDRPLFIAGSAVEQNVVFFPSSAILAGIHKWPAAFFARGLWDYAASLQGTMDSYRRVNGLKELVVVRGPHPYEVWPESEQRRVRERMVGFAEALIQGKSSVGGARPWTNMKELVATASDVWEASTRPTVVK
ncbi:lipase family protein [Peristeroidobacter soli]|uniref:lipase family protein n=1 Tax=Peristeroidobacter soli TaxID=2497877 RepID=UPI001C37CCE4|nr:lipase family protein [Peristeroidobacter soli]